MAFNPFEHHHDHGEHGHEHSHELPTVELDPAQQSLADALRVSFGLLKIVMAALVIVYLLSGIVWGVPEQNVAVRLRFGKIVGDSQGPQILKPGQVYFAFPYPIEQVVMVPTSYQTVSLNQAFWYELPAGQTEEAAQGRAGPLNPEKDGSLLTGDGNIIHAKWTVSYRIERPIDFMQNIASPTGDDQAMLVAAEGVVRAAAEQAIVSVTAQVTAESAVVGGLDTGRAITRIQNTLDQMHAGITITAATAEPTFPLVVKPDFDAVSAAVTAKAQQIDAARRDAARTLTETGGGAYEPVMRLIDQYEVARVANDTTRLAQLDERLDWIFQRLLAPRWAGAAAVVELDARLWPLVRQLDQAQQRGDQEALATAQQQLDQLLDQTELPAEQRGLVPVGGRAAQLLNQARAYRSEVVARIQSDAMAFNPAAISTDSKAQGLLQQYRDNPAVFLNRRYQDMIETILAGKNEVFYLPAGQVYLELNRNPELKRQRERERLEAEQGR